MAATDDAPDLATMSPFWRRYFGARDRAGKAMIGLVEDARGAVQEAGTLLDEAADAAADGAGRTNVAGELRKLRDELDDIANRIDQQRTALR